MRHNVIHRIFITLLGVLALAACKADLPRVNEGTAPIPDGMKAIEVRVQVQNQAHQRGFRSATTGAVLRAETEEEGDADKNAYGKELNENKIDELDLFLFLSTGDLKLMQRASTRERSLTKEVDRNGAVTLRILVPADKISEYENKNFTLVVIANAPQTIGSVQNLEELRKKVETTDQLNPNDLSPQKNFLMDGTITMTPSWASGSASWKASETLMLKRAAAKIRLRIKSVDVQVKGETYTLVGAPKVRMQSYTNKTTLVKQDAACETKEGEWKDTDAREMNLREFHGKFNDKTNNYQFYATAIPFYAYENDWSKQSDHETYLMVEATFKAQNSNRQATYYYRVPVNFQMPIGGMTEEQKKGIHRLQRNHLYDVVTFIALLGSEDPSKPLDLESHIAIQPWNEPDAVDGSIRNAHYLVVKELAPIMPNTNYREIVFASDLPIEIKVDKTWYEYYDEKGVYHKEERVNHSGDFRSMAQFNGVTISTTVQTSKKLVVRHPIPDNFVPFEMEFTVRQVRETTDPLSQKVHVIQYPPKYVTGQKSPGFAPTEAEKRSHQPYADFRFQNTLGAYAEYNSSISLHSGTQSNNVFYRITTIVPVAGEQIGDPTDAQGRTKRDAESNKIISPEFILVTQCGMSITIPQYSGGESHNKWTDNDFGNGYGPYSDHFPYDAIYYRGHGYGGRGGNGNYQPFYRSYTNAQNRCDNYFEGEYGMDGDYVEHYYASDPYYYGSSRKSTRTVHKTFKYKGRWRIPTLAELEYIEKIQRDQKSVVKSILWGRNYWTAKDGSSYSFQNHWEEPIHEANVRCVFDTYKVNDK